VIPKSVPTEVIAGRTSMAIQVIASPVQLSWSQFKEADSIPHGEDAHTDINFQLGNRNFRHANGQYMLADSLTLTVSPIVKVLKGANKTADLLSHEQGHYNIGILVGRAMARELEKLSSPNPHTLAKAASDTFDRHRLTLMPVVQKDYDTATNHSLDATQQARWDGLITAALGAAVCDKLNQNPL
jgi:hypothetical protein